MGFRKGFGKNNNKTNITTYIPVEFKFKDTITDEIFCARLELLNLGYGSNNSYKITNDNCNACVSRNEVRKNIADGNWIIIKKQHVSTSDISQRITSSNLWDKLHEKGYSAVKYEKKIVIYDKMGEIMFKTNDSWDSVLRNLEKFSWVQNAIRL